MDVLNNQIIKVCEVCGEPVYEIDHIETDCSNNPIGTITIYCCSDEKDFCSNHDKDEYHCAHKSYTYKIKGEEDVSSS